MSLTSLLGASLVAIALSILFHAAYSTYEHLSILKSLGKPATTIPTSIWYEAFLSFLVFVPAVAMTTSPLEDITWRGEMHKRMSEETDSRMAFLPLGPAARVASSSSS
ncbi:hypothetical protein NliqN6_0829 [Naganishia liquefaciens]|uniref:Uncharacterized protein n=1 Tax=Naganishia liquefaciens TaxID=104408 RepID=A0A8H3TNR3_9TREE|nr:hypothetical protein NliqN6_0829 [Naganishia liquefaciens]